MKKILAFLFLMFGFARAASAGIDGGKAVEMVENLTREGIEKIINSPTFTILKQYHGRLNLSHFDAYRLEDQDADLGFEEIFDSDDICVIEWAKFIADILPVERLEIIIKKIDLPRK